MDMLAGVVMWTISGLGDNGSGLVGLSGGQGVPGYGSVGFNMVASNVCAYK